MPFNSKEKCCLCGFQMGGAGLCVTLILWVIKIIGVGATQRVAPTNPFFEFGLPSPLLRSRDEGKVTPAAWSREAPSH